jgi:hypothetical protein
VVKVCFFLFIKGLSFLINLSLSEHTWLNVDLSDWSNIYIHCVVSLFLLWLLIFLRLLFCLIHHCVVKLSDNLWVQLFFLFWSFWSKNPIWHTIQGFFTLRCLKIVCIETCRRISL